MLYRARRLLSSLAVASAVLAGAAPALLVALPAEAQSSRPAVARKPVVPAVMGYERISSDLSAPIADEKTREAAVDRIAQLWGGYYQAWQRIDAVEIAAARQALASLAAANAPSAEVLRARQADALSAVDRVDRGFFDKLADSVPPESKPALAALRRARTRAIAAHGLAPELALAVPVRWIDPSAWLQSAAGDVPARAFERYDETTTALCVRFVGPRRRLESELLVLGADRARVTERMPALAADLARTAREVAEASIAAVDALGPDVAADDVARVHIARIEDMYLDTPRPPRPAVLDAMPEDESARELWRAERDRVAIDDAAILRRYEARALETLAPAPLWDKDAYARRRAVAEPFRAERVRLFEDAAARLAALAPAGG